MPAVLFIVKKCLAFWLCYIAGLFIAEGAVILLHFAFGKNMLVGDIFDTQTIALITYYGYIIVAGVVILYWKLIEKKPLSHMGLTKQFGSYCIGAFAGILLLAVSVAVIILTGSIKYQGVYKNADISVILFFIGGFMVQGATEEFLCRGIVLQTLRFNSIWAACGLHSFWNAVLYSALGLNLSGNDETVTAVFAMQSAGKNIWNGGEYGIEASVLTSMVLAIAAVLIWLAGKKVK